MAKSEDSNVSFLNVKNAKITVCQPAGREMDGNPLWKWEENTASPTRTGLSVP